MNNPSFNLASHVAHAAQEADAAHERVNSPQERRREEQRRIAGQRSSQFAELENGRGERMNVSPADVATWRARGWFVVTKPLLP